jgi:hypothetical protein
MPPQPSGSVEADAVISDLQRRIGELLNRACVQTLLGRWSEAAEFRAQADRLQAVLDLLRLAAGGPAAEPGAANL